MRFAVDKIFFDLTHAAPPMFLPRPQVCPRPRARFDIVPPSLAYLANISRQICDRIHPFLLVKFLNFIQKWSPNLYSNWPSLRVAAHTCHWRSGTRKRAFFIGCKVRRSLGLFPGNRPENMSAFQLLLHSLTKRELQNSLPLPVCRRGHRFLAGRSVGQWPLARKFHHEKSEGWTVSNSHHEMIQNPN